MRALNSINQTPLPSLLPEIASSSHCCSRFGHREAIVACSRSSICCSWFHHNHHHYHNHHHHHHRQSQSSVVRKWRLNAAALRVLDAHVNGHTSNLAGVEIPVTCYQIIGVPDIAEKDQIVKSIMVLKNAEAEEGYTREAVLSRQDLLMDVRDKLLFEPEYAGNVKEKIPPKSSLRIPWAWVPGALCLLQEVGEEKLVLDIGRSTLQYPDSKPHVHDVLLSMALAECAIAKTHFEKNQVSQGFEALARAQCLLRSKSSLGKMKLLSEIEESLEGLAPACTLELLAMPQSPDNSERRRGAIAALRELLRQGLDVEASCQVDDWPCFLNQALGKLMASEIVELIPWDNLAVTRKNKKSLESHNQRAVIDFNCFYTALMAHIAYGFSNRQTDLISKAKSISECLMASDGIDLKLEEAFCLFLLGQGSEAEAVERLHQLESSKKPASKSSLLGNKDKDTSLSDYSLEKWLKDAVLCLFSDTRDCSPLLASFFSREKRIVGNKHSKGVSQTTQKGNHRMISAAVSSDRIVADERLASLLSSQHLGPAVKQLAPTNLRNPLQENRASSQSDVSMPSPQLKRDIIGHRYKSADSWMFLGQFVGRITLVTVLGSILFATSKMFGRKTGRLYESKLANRKPNQTVSSLHGDCAGQDGMDYKVGSGLKQLLSKLRIKIPSHHYTGKQQNSCLTASLSSPVPVVYNREMPIEEAEALVRQWQAIKSEALGPDHQIHLLFDILDESMLHEWQALAEAARTKSCFWRFVLLQLSVLRADILSDNVGPEEAEIEVLLEEAAELVDENQQKNPNYYSSYRISYVLRRQGDGSWKFCKADIDASS